ncbi:MAG: thiosulfate oxidation carrier complex protein SoxZ [Burkholderiaceae bacterium]|nr:thiosulfate oxidation carrier complex protein SoxZ [Sulfuritalea sp.]MCF8174927.1 thiosulfate oxidation carrier complex protein SoxZ [Burkholderiaceae bacterium]MCF8183576.1 thiosulfate oxidation carrier complex protein SoxZ [Polynucleobacter sp.]
MSDPMKIRAKLSGDVAEIRVLMGHAMETGQRKDAAGKTIPAHFIQSMTVEVAGKIVVDGQIGTSVSRNPVFGFKVKGAKAGDKVVISWVDNKGDKRSDEVAVA